MKKKSIKKFELEKTTIVSFENMKSIQGGTNTNTTPTKHEMCQDPEDPAKSVLATVGNGDTRF